MTNLTVEYFIKIIVSSKKLKNKDKEILIKRLKGMTLEKIGKKYHLTGERIRQLEEKGIEKLVKKIYQLVLFDS